MAKTSVSFAGQLRGVALDGGSGRLLGWSQPSRRRSCYRHGREGWAEAGRFTCWARRGRGAGRGRARASYSAAFSSSHRWLLRLAGPGRQDTKS